MPNPNLPWRRLSLRGLSVPPPPYSFETRPPPPSRRSLRGAAGQRAAREALSVTPAFPGLARLTGRPAARPVPASTAALATGRPPPPVARGGPRSNRAPRATSGAPPPRPPRRPARRALVPARGGGGGVAGCCPAVPRRRTGRFGGCCGPERRPGQRRGGHGRARAAWRGQRAEAGLSPPSRAPSTASDSGRRALKHAGAVRTSWASTASPPHTPRVRGSHLQAEVETPRLRFLFLL